MRVRWYVWLAPLLALMAGYLTGPKPQAQANATVSVPNSSLTLEYPVDWRRASPPTAIGRLDLPQAIVIAPQGDAGESGLLAAAVSEEGSLLPKGVLARLSGGLHGEAISLVGSPAFRYRDLSIPGSSLRLTAYSVPTGLNRFTLAMCFAPRDQAAAQMRCEEIVESGQVPPQGGASPAELRPQPAYAKGLSAALAGLEQARRQARSEMAGKPTPAVVVRASTSLVDAFENAEAKLAKLRPHSIAAGAGTVLAHSVLGARLAYDALAAAADSGAPQRFALARRQVQAAEASLHSAIQGFGLLGYRLA